jgi:hypothetical protein
MMTRSLLAVLVLPMAIAACNRAPEPEPVAAVMTGPETACANAAANTLGVDPAAVAVMPGAPSKTGAMVYTATVDGADYTCVVEADGTVSQFG